uniref:Methylated-DNA--protein-cysteine methyltransferase n=1 Tax=Phaeomonas parva TaxID=124430 RepID=A0A6U4JDP1_9STRA|mmetsp:Transcript_43297/g.135536  ORF Transcript_43297/g.135536 Transcript_43297/m.135536 type:complete len:174 (+) Transcript_43297:94-615(+)|eukprot:CAMPEP_0118859170 /NCGR_PEP_ID=MMETSP1163-20130328/5532_1 /TAXON_ID=124430 /ORGANISM="Phaeomonas parva, Strain CCMP2877" /LENGTH=173 /DNA_ID=CAMNT_0006792719 /DNA_START=186 /DNA_END=707 /DNA_ORIENTATION=-
MAPEPRRQRKPAVKTERGVKAPAAAAELPVEMAGKNLKVTAFRLRVLAACAAIPPGRVASYGEIAARLRSSARAVGGALRRNPFAPTVPCHRVVAATGHIGGFSGVWDKAAKPTCGPPAKKIKLLKGEGVAFTAMPEHKVQASCFVQAEEDLDVAAGEEIVRRCMAQTGIKIA